MSRKKGKTREGIFRGSVKGYGFVKIDGTEEEVYISKDHTKGALNGDRVCIKILEEKQENDFHQEGKVVEVLERERDTLVGIFQKSRNFGFVVPDDKKFGTDIYISKKNMGKARSGHKVLVKILKYPVRGKNAEGKVIEVIGNVNAAGVDMLSLIKEYDLPYRFPDFVVEEAKKIPQQIDPKSWGKREDLTKREIFTIDGKDAKDLDDAVCVEKTKNGTYLLGVHIADVSHYVKEESKLDQEAILRGTSIYMMDRVIPMLPRELSNGICSLNAGTDRFAISVWMEVNEKGKVISSDVKKSVIHVTERMNYTDVTKILDRSDEAVLKRYEPYIEHFDRMKELAEILMERRKKEGSLDLDLPESKIILNQDGIAIDVQKEELTIANKIIEQFMLLANETIAERFYWLEAPFIYRVHEVPDMDKIEELNKFLYNFGYKIKATKEQVYPKAFADVLEEIKGKPEERVISNLILRTLKIAKYESENKGHFGIASKYYCHFTSPIRRYPDLFIHRIISMYLENPKQMNEVKKEIYRSQAVRYAETSSEREKIAQKVEREAIQIKMAEYMQEKVGEEFDGVISSITSFGMFVELENTVEGLIRFENLGEDYYIYDENRKTLFGERTKAIFKIGDSIRIRVIRANKELREIDFERVIPEEKQEEKDEIVD